MTTFKQYTVLLLYPDYMTDDYGQATYMAWVMASNPKAAVVAAKAECVEDSRMGPGCDPTIESPDDLHVLFACEGHHNDVGQGL
jgi:hypothetical protein